MSLSDEAFTQLAGAGAVRIERIVSWGHRSPPDFWYDQAEFEYVVLLAGAAKIEFFPDSRRSLGPGDWLEIPPHVRHRVAWTDPDRATVWLAVFYPGDD